MKANAAWLVLRRVHGRIFLDDKTLNGSLAEASVLKKLIAEGWDIFQSFSGKTKFDLVVYREDFGILSVQVKSTTQITASGSYPVTIKSTRSNKSVNTIYNFNVNDQDILAVYIVSIDAIVFYVSKKIKTVSVLTISALDALNLSQKTLEETLADSA